VAHPGMTRGPHAVKAVARADLNLVGLAMRGERKVIDKIVDGLKFYSYAD
jgi:hypothetical protein